MKAIASTIISVFKDIEDPRVNRRKIHNLEHILFIALCTYLTGGESFYDMEGFAKARQEWLKQSIGLKSVPSHDTFNRVFQMLSPEALNTSLVEIARRLRGASQDDIVSFDGKTNRGSGKERGSQVHILNAWSSKYNLALGQVGVDQKSNEITAVPALMELLELKGSVVTADALNTQKNIVAKAREKKADYVLALKQNHPVFYSEVSAFMDKLSEEKEPFVEVAKGHGRLEIRKVWQSEDIGWYADKDKWLGLKSFVKVEAIRQISDSTPKPVRRYYISSLPKDEERLANVIRSHWGIENKLHWYLDVHFNEDQCRARTRNASKNLSVLRKIALNVIRNSPGKDGPKRKKYTMALNFNYFLLTLNSI